MLNSISFQYKPLFTWTRKKQISENYVILSKRTQYCTKLLSVGHDKA